jgi:hypothetical protein
VRACLALAVWLVCHNVALAAQPIELSIETTPSLAGVAARVERIDYSAATRMLAQAGLPVPPRARLLLIDVSDPVAQQTPPWVVGSAFGTDTVVIFPQRIGPYPYNSLDAVVIHELAHLALSIAADGRPLPRWFHEGVAVSVESGWGITSQARLLWAASEQPAIDDVSRLFASDSHPATSTAYILSAALVEDIRRRHGPGIPGVIAARVAAGAAFDDAFLAAAGETPDAAATRAWRVYRGLRWLPFVTSPSSVWGLIMVLAGLAFAAQLRRRRLRRQQWEAEEMEEVIRASVQPGPPVSDDERPH